VIPDMSPITARVVGTLVGNRGRLGQADLYSRCVGIRNRRQLRRVRDASGLPSLEDLAGWIQALGWVVKAEHSARRAILRVTRLLRWCRLNGHLTRRLSLLTRHSERKMMPSAVSASAMFSLWCQKCTTAGQSPEGCNPRMISRERTVCSTR
jgi:hypothetical protein